MPKGRPADPTRARRRTGNRPIPGDALPAVVGASDTPDYPLPLDLPGEALEMYQRVIRELAPRGLREADLDALTMMCHSAYVHLEARRKIAEHGVLVKGPRGPMVNPLIKVARDEAQTYLRIANEYGLTLAARLRLGLMQLAGESMLQSLSSDLDRPDVEVRVNV